MTNIPINLGKPESPSVILTAGTAAASSVIAAQKNPQAAVMIFNPGTLTAFIAMGGTATVNTGFPIVAGDHAGPLMLPEAQSATTVSAIVVSGTIDLRLTVVRPTSL